MSSFRPSSDVARNFSLFSEYEKVDVECSMHVKLTLQGTFGKGLCLLWKRLMFVLYQASR